MNKPTYRGDLPQLNAQPMLCDGGIETTLIFHDGCDLPHFAAFTLLQSQKGTQTLRAYFKKYIDVAIKHRLGLVLESPTWRANPDWGVLLGYDAQALAAANEKAINLLHSLRNEFEADQPFIISGCLGPRGDGYEVGEALHPQEAAEYHMAQIAAFDKAGVDMVSAITMTHPMEAIGVTRACAERGLPVSISFTVETNGRLPSGETLEEAIGIVDGDWVGGPDYYMINCAHPDHFITSLIPGASWTQRIRGVRANASRLSHAELDEADTLDEGDPYELACLYGELRRRLPNLSVYGGCCGTDHRHIEAIACRVLT